MPKINFMIYFFLKILYFKESCNFRLFPRKTNDKIFQKIKKNYFVTILGPLCPNLGKKIFFLEKRALSVFKYSNYVPL